MPALGAVTWQGILKGSSLLFVFVKEGLFVARGS